MQPLPERDPHDCTAPVPGGGHREDCCHLPGPHANHVTSTMQFIEPVPWPGVGGHPLDIVFVHVIEEPRWSDEDEEYQTSCSCGWAAEGDKGGVWYAISQHEDAHPGAKVRD